MSRVVRLLAIFSAIFTTLALPAQNPADARRNGERAYADQRWREAQMFLAQYQEAKPGDLSILAKLGISLYQLRRGEEARKYLEYVANKSAAKPDPENLYYLARTQHGLAEWEKAIGAYKAFLRAADEHNPLRANAVDNIKRCVSGMQALENPAVALVENMGDHVNTAGDEFAPIPSVNHQNRIYFASAKAGSNGGERNDDGYEDSRRGHWCSDIYMAQLNNSGWETQGGVSGLLNTSRYEVPLGFNANGQILYFFRGFTLYGGEIYADTAMRKDEYALESPTFKSPVNAQAGDRNPFFINDSLIIFASRRPGGFGGMDLWWTRRSDSTWTEPQNMGEMVNSTYDEDMPFLARDGAALYFSSNRTESIGGLDVFKCAFDAQKHVWKNAESLGAPINSPDDDAYFRLATDGRSAYFASDRMGGLGQRDLFVAYFQEALAEQTQTVQTPLFAANPDRKNEDSEIREIVIPTLPYRNDKDVVSADNLKIVDQVAGLARNFPQTYVQATVFSTSGAQSKFDLYNGIKRAELLGKALQDRGIPAERILLKSVGGAYPMAREVLDAQPNPNAAAFNNRVELRLTALDALPAPVRLERPVVPEYMAAGNPQTMDETLSGLSYRVEAVQSRQILTNDALAMFSDLMIETQPGAGAYRYMAGLFKSYKDAAQLKKELLNQGFTDTTVVAYLNGIRVSKADAVALIKKYPDLAAYVRG